MKRTPLQRMSKARIQRISKARIQWMKASPAERKTILRSRGQKGWKLERHVVNLRALAPDPETLIRRSKYKRRPRFFDFMAWVRSLPCLLSGAWGAIFPIARMTPCYGEVQADHLGDRPVSRKAPDSTCAPMCQGHHEQRTYGTSVGNGAFWNHRAAEMRAWRHNAIQMVQLHALRCGIDVPDDGGRSPAYLAALANATPSTGGIPF